MQSHIRKVYARLAVTCHLHFWQNDRDLLRATVVTWGWNGYRNKSQHRKSTLEKKILPPLQQGFESATFQSRVQCFNHWAIPICLLLEKRCFHQKLAHALYSFIKINLRLNLVYVLIMRKGKVIPCRGAKNRKCTRTNSGRSGSRNLEESALKLHTRLIHWTLQNQASNFFEPLYNYTYSARTQHR